MNITNERGQVMKLDWKIVVFVLVAALIGASGIYRGEWFGMAYICALTGAGFNTLFAGFALSLGMITGYGTRVALIRGIAVTLAAVLSRTSGRRNISSYSMVVCAILLISENVTLKRSVGETIVFTLLGAAFTYIMIPGAVFIKNYKKSDEKVLTHSVAAGLLIPFAVALKTIDRFVFDISLGTVFLELTVLLFLILWSGYARGSGIAGLCAVLGSIMYCAGENGFDMTRAAVLAGCFSTAAALSCLVRRNDIITRAGVFIVTLTLLQRLISYEERIAYVFGKNIIGAGITAYILFVVSALLAGKRYTGKETVRERKSFDSMLEGKRQMISERLSGYSKAFEELSSKMEMEAAAQEDIDMRINKMFDSVSGEVCPGCELCTDCWRENYNFTALNTMNLFEGLIKNGEIVIDDERGREFENKCLHYESFINNLKMTVRLFRMEDRWQSGCKRMKETVSDQFRLLAETIDNMRKELDSRSVNPDKFSVKLKERLDALGLELDHLAVSEDEGGHLIVTVDACAGKDHLPVKKIEQEISSVCGKTLTAPFSQGDRIGNVTERFVFREKPKFHTLTGVARITRTDEKMSGDNYSFAHLEDGKVVMVLCDGMGSGNGANRQSSEIVEMVEVLISAGFDEEKAVSFVNCVNVWNSDEKVYSLDLGLLNTYTGTMTFIKEGSAATFIKRRNWVESISSETVPGGILINADFETSVKKLYNGDYVIMVSDGILQCFNDSEDRCAVGMLEDIIAALSEVNPERMAADIIEKCAVANGYEARDDMTVMVMGVFS